MTQAADAADGVIDEQGVRAVEDQPAVVGHGARAQRAATKVTSLLYLTPPTTALMAWLLFDEPFNLMMATGLALTMTGVVLVNARQSNTVATIAE